MQINNIPKTMHDTLPVFKCRASCLGKIMTQGRGSGITDKQLEKIQELQDKPKLTEKQEDTLNELIAKRDAPPQLSATAKSYCITWVKEQVYAREQDFTSKYTDKGNACEDEAIVYAGIDGKKNEQWYENDFITGTPDVVLSDTIIDIKNSWDCFTFPLFENTIPTTDYEWQVRGYMWMLNRDKAEVTYTLMNTPTDIVEKEYWRATGMNPKGSETGILIDAVFTPEFREFSKHYQYTDIEDRYRIKTYKFTRDKELEQQIRQRVELCRDFIKQLTQNHE